MEHAYTIAEIVCVVILIAAGLGFALYAMNEMDKETKRRQS